MIKKFMVLAVLANLCGTELSAQIKDAGVLSAQQIKELAKENDTTSLLVFDRLARSKTRFILESPSLRTPQGFVLPASEWAFYTFEKGKYHQMSGGKNIVSDSNAILCWLGCNDSTSTLQWGKKLSRKYGKINTAQGELAVPARWVSDTLYIALFPSRQAGMWVAEKSYPEWVVRNGIAQSVPYEEKNNAERKPTLREWVMDLRPDLFQTLDGDGRNQRDIERQELTLLAYDVNRNLPETSLPAEDTTFMIHVFETAGGNLDMELLSPSPASPAQQALADELRTAFRQITTLHIPTRRLLQGKTLPGCLLNAKKEICWRFNSITSNPQLMR